MKIKCVNYFKEYECLTSDCVNDCCNGWTIEVIPETIKKWKDKAPELLDNIHNNSYRPETKCMKTQEDRSCIMLTDGLCSIHNNHGTDMLPNICNYFPQLYKKINGELFLTATVSCPATARLIINDNEESNFFFSEIDYDWKKDEKSIHESLGDSIDYNFLGIYEFLIQEIDYYKRPRYFLMSLYYFSEILDQTDIHYLGDLYDKIYEVSNPQIKRVNCEPIDEGSLLSVLRSIKILSTRSKTYIKQIIGYVDHYLDNPEQVEDLLKIYLEIRDNENYDKYLRRFIKAKLSETIFPFGVVDSIYNDALILINEFIMLELMITIFHIHQDIDEDLVANLIHSIDREFYAKNRLRILEALDEEGMCDKDNIFSFLV